MLLKSLHFLFDLCELLFALQALRLLGFQFVTNAGHAVHARTVLLRRLVRVVREPAYSGPAVRVHFHVCRLVALSALVLGVYGIRNLAVEFLLSAPRREN